MVIYLEHHKMEIASTTLPRCQQRISNTQDLEIDDKTASEPSFNRRKDSNRRSFKIVWNT